MKRYFKSGSYNAVCQSCGFTYKAEELKKRWDGLMVCDQDFETRNPQDLIRVPKDNPSVPWASPEAFIFLTYDLSTQAGDHLLTEGGDNLVW